MSFFLNIFFILCIPIFCCSSVSGQFLFYIAFSILDLEWFLYAYGCQCEKSYMEVFHIGKLSAELTDRPACEQGVQFPVSLGNGLYCFAIIVSYIFLFFNH